MWYFQKIEIITFLFKFSGNGQHRSNYLHFDKTMNGTANQNNPKKPLLDVTEILNEDQENEIKITGYRLVWFKWFLTMIAMVLR